MHGIVHGYNSKTFENTWTFNADRNVDRTLRNANDLFVPPPNFENYKRFPLYDFAKSWNNLGEIKYQQNLGLFKLWLKNDTFLNLETLTAPDN